MRPGRQGAHSCGRFPCSSAAEHPGVGGPGGARRVCSLPSAHRARGRRPVPSAVPAVGDGASEGRRLPVSLAHLAAPAAAQAPSPALFPHRASRSGHCHSSKEPPVSTQWAVACPGGCEVSMWQGQEPQRWGHPTRKSKAVGVGVRWARTAAPVISDTAPLSLHQDRADAGQLRAGPGPASRQTADTRHTPPWGVLVLPAPP